MKRKVYNRAISILTVLSVCLAVTLTSAASVNAAQEKYDLPASSTEYIYQEEWDDDGNVTGGSWISGGKTSYKYDKYGRVISISGTKYKWTYKKDLPVKMTTGKKKQSAFVTKTFDKKGRLVSISSAWYGKNGKKTGDSIDLKYKYNKKGWISKASFKWGGENKSHTAKYKYSFRKNGLPEKVTASGSGANWKMLKVNKKGLITSISIPDLNDCRYIYTYDKKGRVKTAVMQEKEDGKWKNSTKSVYHYKKYKTADKKAYFAAINLIKSGSGYDFLFLDDVVSNAYSVFGRG